MSSPVKPASSHESGPQDHMDPGLVSIVGMVRSGSTFLEGRLADLYDSVAVGELVGAWSAFDRGIVLCSCGKKPQECSFWAKVLDFYPGLQDANTVAFMKQTNRELMPIRHYREWRRVVKSGGTIPGENGKYHRYRSETAKLYSAIHDAAQAFNFQVVIDSSKHPIFYCLAKASGGLDTYRRSDTLRLVRDPRAVIYSLSRPKKQATSDGGTMEMTSYSMASGVPYWWAMNVASDKSVGKETPLLRYEDLANELYLPTMMDFGYLQSSDTAGNSRHQLVANPDRQRGSVAFVLDTRWKTSRRRGSRLAIIVLYPRMRRYGYRLRA